MTCIAAIADGETVWMGGDSASVHGDNIQICFAPKVVRREQFLIGCAGDTRFTQVVRYAFDPPAYQPTHMSPDKFMAVHFLGKLQCVLKDHGAMRYDDGRQWANAGMLVGFAGRLFQISEDFSFVENTWKYDAIGSGQDFALGAFFATLPANRYRPYERIQMALDAASRHSVGVDGPFTILSTEQPPD